MAGSASEASVKIEKLSNDNYVTWSANVEHVLKLKNCWKAVGSPPPGVQRMLEGDEPLPSRSELLAVLQIPGATEDVMAIKVTAREHLAVLDWKRKDEVALATLHLNVAEIHHATFRVCRTARGAWAALEELFRSRNMARSMDMRRRLATISKRTDEGMIEYINRGTMLHYELGQLGQDQPEAELVAALLSGLPASYANTVELLEDQGVPSLRRVTERLMAAEVKRLAASESRNKDRAVAYAAGPGDRRAAPSAKARVCFHCDRPGHIQRFCPELRRRERGDGLAMAVVGRRGVLVGDGSLPVAAWIVDSGASHHMTGDASVIVGQTTVPPVHVRMPNGSTVTATQSGTVPLPVWAVDGSTTLTLQDVLHVPGMEVNLFSVQAIMERGFGANFRDGKVSIFRGGARVLDGVRAGAVHVLPTINGGPETDDYGDPLGFAGAAVGAAVWHRRLGHCGAKDLKRVAKAADGMRMNGVGAKEALSKGCKSCQVSKQVRASYYESTSLTTVFLELAHTDVAGPMAHVSIGGAVYWVTVIDDYTKMAAFVPIQRKDEAAGAVRRVLTQWETQTGAKLQRLRSDRGGEYLGASFQGWLAEKGVVHQKTAPYSPQQNGKAERYNRTLEERTVAMLADANLEGNLWADAVVTANYTLNRIPRQGRVQTPYEMTYGKRPSVGHLRTFGCRAYVLTPAPLRRKLQPRSKRGTFIGYEAGSKAYRFLIDGKVLVRRDAVFEEDDLTNAGDASSDEDEDGSSDDYDDNDGGNPGPPDEAGADGADDGDADNVTDDTTGDGMTPPSTARGLGKTPPPTADAGGSQEKVAATGARADGARVVRLANPPTAAPGGSHIEEGGDITDAIAAAKLLVTGSKGESDDEEATGAAGPSGGHRRSGRHRAEPERFGQGGEAMAVRGVTNPDKMTLSQARKEADWPSFDAAVRAEVDSLWGNGTWVLADLPPGAKLLPAQMLCERKRGADGEVDRHKGRFVACGNH